MVRYILGVGVSVVMGVFFSSLVFATQKIVPPEYIEGLRKNSFISELDHGISLIHRKTSYGVAAVRFTLDWSRSDQMFHHNWDLHRKFVAALMTKQTQRYSKEQINKLKMIHVERLYCYPTPGCSNSGRLSCDMVMPQENFPQAMDLMSSVILEPKFSAKDLKVLQEKALVSIRSCELNEKNQVARKLDAIMMSPSHWLHRHYDLRPHVEKLTVEDLEKTYRYYLNGRRMYFGVVGPYRHKDLVREVKARFGKVRGWHFVKPVLNYRSQINPPSTYHKERIVVLEKEDYPNVHVSLYPYTTSPERYSSYRRASYVLGSVMGAKFFEAMRVHKGLTYAPHASYSSISFSTSQLPQAMKVTKEFVEQMRRDPLQGSPISEFKNKRFSSFYSNYTSSLSVADRLIDYYLAEGFLEGEYDYPEELEAVDEDTVRFLAAKLLRGYKMSFLGPKKLLGDVSVYENYFDPPVVVGYP